MLTVVAERKVRGAAERSYRLVLEAAQVDAAGRTGEDHRRAFTTFVAMLLADFDGYLRRSAPRGPDLARDRVGYRQAAVWVTDGEFDEMVAELRDVVRARMADPPGDGRRRRLVTTVVLPAD